MDEYKAVFGKLNKEFRLLNKSVKALNNNNGELTSTINEQRQNQIMTKLTTERLAVSVTQLESRVQGLKKFSNNMSSIAGSLKRGYTQMNTLIKSLEAVNSAQNASHDNLWSFYNSFNDALATVNATMNDQVRLSATEFNSNNAFVFLSTGLTKQTPRSTFNGYKGTLKIIVQLNVENSKKFYGVTEGQLG